MFKSRRRALSNPPPNRNASAPTPTAALAASQAFLKSATSNASLSSAAAAAALRSHTTSPVPIGNVQTKRMQRRGSGSSASSAPGVRRQTSSGSMSERTFRSPSPGRARTAASVDANAPPVPAIPKDVSPASQHRRAVSEVVPGPSKLGDRATGAERGTTAATQGASRAAAMSQASDQSKDGNQRASINFSRPISPRATPPSSPPPTKTSHSGWFTGPVTTAHAPRQDIRSTVPIVQKPPAAGAPGLQKSIHNVANAPVAKKKKKKAPGVEGTHLSGGSMAGRLTGTAVHRDSPPPERTQSPPPPLPAGDVPPSPQSSSLSDSSVDSDNSGSRIRAPHLVRQPSTVMENPEVEEYAERNEAKQLSSELTVDPVSGIKEQQRRAASPPSNQRLGRGTDTLKPSDGQATVQERQHSLSPARSAHFAPNAVDVSNSVKHKPPPRSLSPAKSALKHSPSSSIRTSSPVTFNASARVPSDNSSDAGSYEGIKTSPRKKKGVRVSFDDNIGREDSPSPTGSPGGLESSQWSGRTLQGMDDDLDAIMKPRPALPSFGSIKRAHRPADEEVAEKVTETVPSSMTNSTSTMVESLGPSSDHIAGSILAQNFEAKRRARDPNEPVAPEVTSVEGSGYVSDDTISTSDDEDLETARKSDTNPVAKVLEGGTQRLPDIPEKRSAESLPVSEQLPVPQIAVQPATPGTEVENQEPTFEMPGAWSDRDEESADDSLATTTASLVSQDQAQDLGLIHGGRFQVFSAKDLQPIESRQSLDHYLQDIHEESSSDDDSSIYSDAAEDLSDLEGGFASLDAIVESPIVAPARGGSFTSTESPVLEQKEMPQQHKEVDEKAAITPEDRVQAKKSLAEPRTQQGDADVEAAKTISPRQPEATPILKPAKPKKKRATVVPEPVAVAAAPSQRPASLPQAREAPKPKKPALRNSMRAERPGARNEEPSVPSMRKTMRASMRDGPAGLAASRYSDAATEGREPKGALQKRNIPLATTKVAAVPHRRSVSAVTPAPTSNRVSTMPALGRTWSNGSDASDSSFKRERRRASTSHTDGKFNLRRSMRTGPSPEYNASSSGPTLRSGTLRSGTLRASSPVAATRSSKLSIRSLSPTGSLFGKRKPMVAPQEPSHPTLRMQGPPPSKSSRFAMGKSSAKAAAPKSLSSRFQSRFDDSSDEEEGGRLPTFRSRFADSDDEDDVPELPSSLRPVRGIPRKRGEEDGDSTELEDEESDTEVPSSPPQTAISKEIERASVQPQVATNGNTNGGGVASRSGKMLPQGSLRDSKYATESPLASPRKEKRGFFGLGKKRRDSADTRPQTPPGGISLLATGSPTGKLHRRTSQPRNPESWPLPPPIPDEPANTTSGRPTTSDGPPARPMLGKRQSSGGETAASAPIITSTRDDRGGDLVLGRSGKKKKFPMLRKAFGLKD